MRASGLSPDWLEPERPLAVPITFRTDGTWLWADELGYYLREHGIVPERDFLVHMGACGFEAAVADEQAIAEAERLLEGDAR
jgi:hypothetical protein